ncbi:hypothetical protein HDV00_012562 [Rhizophlyctis rosea]|nr:hypothetical protein HDV00_012562 [Rhizophlyctis rosea]
MPGLAFDKAGWRIGHGKGYYDRFLQKCLDLAASKSIAPPVTVALALSEQLISTSIPREPHDRKPDLLITPEGIIRSGTLTPSPNNPTPTLSQQPRKTILFCRAKSEPEDDASPTTSASPSEDPYETLSLSNSFTPLFLPTLEHVPCNQETLTTTLKSVHDYASLIVTSKRALETLPSVLKTVDPTTWSQWQHKPIFVVGTETARVAEEMGFVDVRGRESGRAEVLCGEIVGEKERFAGKKVLFLVGSKHRPTVPSALRDAGVEFDTIVVYKTEGVDSERIDRQVDELLRDAGARKADWVVFFSPLGVETVLPVLRGKDWWGGVKVGVIGPTTGKRVEEMGGVVGGVSGRPCAEGLVEAVLEGERKGDWDGKGRKCKT